MLRDCSFCSSPDSLLFSRWCPFPMRMSLAPRRLLRIEVSLLPLLRCCCVCCCVCCWKLFKSDRDRLRDGEAEETEDEVAVLRSLTSAPLLCCVFFFRMSRRRTRSFCVRRDIPSVIAVFQSSRSSHESAHKLTGSAFCEGYMRMPYAAAAPSSSRSSMSISLTNDFGVIKKHPFSTTSPGCK